MEEEISVEVTGFVSALSEFEDVGVKAKVDILSYMNTNNIMELEEGTYEMELKFDLPQNVWTEDKIRTKIVISKK